MTILCFDADVILNVLLKEVGLWHSSFQLLQKVENGTYEGLISLLAVMEIHRVLQKCKRKEKEIMAALEKIYTSRISVAVPTEGDIFLAYQLVQRHRIGPFDALHVAVACALADLFVTRDQKLLKLKGVSIPILTPEAVLERSA